MNVLPEGSKAPDLEPQNPQGPSVLVFAMPHIYASRLVVGYLRRLKEQLPELSITIILQGNEDQIERYARGYLEALKVVHDRDLALSERFAVTHVPTTYYLEDDVVALAFSGFSRPALNRLAAKAAEALGTKPKELITASDNKGEYELAEPALSWQPADAAKTRRN
jgi:hypothetical protein